MGEFVDKIRKGETEYEIRDTEGRTKLEGHSLLIPGEYSPEQPVITIDNVDYFHKCEIDLSAFEYNSANAYKSFDLLTGLEIEESQISHLYTSGMGGNAVSMNLILGKGSGLSFRVYKGTGYMDADYTSRAFTVVDNPVDVDDNTKIYLPTCSSYYGFLSEDGKIFISYFNLKSDGESVVSVKQGNAVLPIKDSRVPDSKVADAGKVVKVGDDGKLALANSEGGTKLYSHFIKFNGGGTPQSSFEFISTVGTKIASQQEFVTFMQTNYKTIVSTAQANLTVDGEYRQTANLTIIGYTSSNMVCAYGTTGSAPTIIMVSPSNYANNFTFLSDTVTAL